MAQLGGERIRRPEPCVISCSGYARDQALPADTGARTSNRRTAFPATGGNARDLPLAVLRAQCPPRPAFAALAETPGRRDCRAHPGRRGPSPLRLGPAADRPAWGD